MFQDILRGGGSKKLLKLQCLFFFIPASPKYINRYKRIDQTTLTKSVTTMTFQTNTEIGNKSLSTDCLMCSRGEGGQLF